MRSKGVTIFVILSAIAGLLWISGLGMTLYRNVFSPQPQVSDSSTGSSRVGADKPTLGTGESSAMPVTNDGIIVLGLGDSLTRGVGDPNGKGYMGYTVERLQEKTKQKVTAYNLSISGQRSEQLAAQIKQSEVQRQIKSAQVILMTIGGNDLNRSGQTQASMNPAMIQALTKEYTGNLTGILADLRKLNSEATICLLGIYNPYSQQADGMATSAVVRNWNAMTAETAAQFPKTVFVPIYDLFQLKADQFLSLDAFHPNAAGYQRMADRLVPLILESEAFHE
ncbi:SGNH/GDSL hydrolase family protein [Heliophilum fasciatum]|uniref:Lysophospholipase L1-like esterase n=1 Tax=Heliophilum fasciatum TaxID=35700 RepID=A0A4R2SCS2_9FIRM|nr:SGNH/GDSL hydrolase family protein [Heliophilum fasciatum]MCW2276674.1 lysophospholipase L1-like esterase [Heliophilum fasciatum]TCP68945.1 lysophospholipase L1-like esterase [Heliophilum fasciatum]